MARQDESDTYVRSHGKKRQGFSRKGTGVKYQNLYPTDPDARRRLNSAVNKQYAKGWVHVEDEG